MSTRKALAVTELLPVTALEVARSNSLFEIDDELQSLMERAHEEESGAGLTEDTKQALTLYFDAATQKVDRIAMFIRTCEMLDAAKKAEKKRLDDRGRALQNAIARCKNMLKEFMQRQGKDSLDGKLNHFSLQDNPPALKITDESRLPSWSRRVKVDMLASEWVAASWMFTVTADKVEYYIAEGVVREALERKEEVPGAELTQGQHLRLR